AAGADGDERTRPYHRLAVLTGNLELEAPDQRTSLAQPVLVRSNLVVPLELRMQRVPLVPRRFNHRARTQLAVISSLDRFELGPQLGRADDPHRSGRHHASTLNRP